MSDIYEKQCTVLWELYRKVVPANNDIISAKYFGRKTIICNGNWSEDYDEYKTTDTPSARKTPISSNVTD